MSGSFGLSPGKALSDATIRTGACWPAPSASPPSALSEPTARIGAESPSGHSSLPRSEESDGGPRRAGQSARGEVHRRGPAATRRAKPGQQATKPPRREPREPRDEQDREEQEQDVHLRRRAGAALDGRGAAREDLVERR